MCRAGPQTRRRLHSGQRTKSRPGASCSLSALVSPSFPLPPFLPYPLFSVTNCGKTIQHEISTLTRFKCHQARSRRLQRDTVSLGDRLISVTRCPRGWPSLTAGERASWVALRPGDRPVPFVPSPTARRSQESASYRGRAPEGARGGPVRYSEDSGMSSGRREVPPPRAAPESGRGWRAAAVNVAARPRAWRPHPSPGRAAVPGPLHVGLRRPRAPRSLHPSAATQPPAPGALPGHAGRRDQPSSRWRGTKQTPADRGPRRAPPSRGPPASRPAGWERRK